MAERECNCWILLGGVNVIVGCPGGQAGGLGRARPEKVRRGQTPPKPAAFPQCPYRASISSISRSRCLWEVAGQSF